MFPIAEAHEETKLETVERVARETGFAAKILTNVVDAETGRTWDCTLEGRDGEVGCFQIIPQYHPNVDPTNFEESARYFVSQYQAGYGYHWTSCSCVQTARLTVPNLPKRHAKDFAPNATLQTGKIAILDYDGERHVVAYEIRPEGIFSPLEGNFGSPCSIGPRLITWQELETHLVGFYSPDLPEVPIGEE